MNLEDTSIQTSVHVKPSSSRAVHKTDPVSSPAKTPHAAPQALSTTCQASQEPRHNSSQHNVQQRKIQPPSARRALRHVKLHKSGRQPHAAVPMATVRDHSNSSSHNTTIPRCVQRPTHQTTLPRELTKALANKTRLHSAQEGPLLKQMKGHGEVLMRRETGLMKLWQVECRLASCMLHCVHLGNTCTCVNW